MVLVVQDWGGLLGLTLPMEAPQRYTGLLVMNTTLGTGDAPLPAGFVAWREMCAKNPEFDVARLFARGNPQMSAAECAAYSALSRTKATARPCAPFRPWCRTALGPTAPPSAASAQLLADRLGGQNLDGGGRAGPGAGARPSCVSCRR